MKRRGGGGKRMSEHQTLHIKSPIYTILLIYVF